MVNVFKMIAEKKAKMRETQMKKARSNLTKAKEIATQRKALAKEKAEIQKIKAQTQKLKGGSKLKAFGDYIKKNQERNNGVFSGSGTSAFSTSTRNMHEGVGRNIWDEKPKVKKKKTKKKTKKKQIVINI